MSKTTGILRDQGVLFVAAYRATAVGAWTVNRLDAGRRRDRGASAIEMAVITAVILGAAIWIGTKVYTAVTSHGNDIN